MADRTFSPVADRVLTMIEQASDREDFRTLLTGLLARPGRILGPSGSAKWPAYVLGTCRALGGDLTAAVGAAAAVEFIIASADVVDDLVDDEWDNDRVEWSRALNASHGLTWLAHRCISELAETLGAERSCLIAQIVAREALRSCRGEDLDLLMERSPRTSAEAVVEMTMLKSGSLVAMACQVGAAVATDEARAISLAGEFGRHAGTVAQLLNDIGGVSSGSDLRRRKKTLPVAYALRCAKEEALVDLMAWYKGIEASRELSEEQVSRAMRRLGALDYAAVVAEVHRQEALARVRDLIRVSGRKEVAEMRRLVPRVWAPHCRGVVS